MLVGKFIARKFALEVTTCKTILKIGYPGKMGVMGHCRNMQTVAYDFSNRIGNSPSEPTASEGIINEILIKENIGIVGFGQMTGAMVKGFLQSGVTEPEKLYVSSASNREQALNELKVKNVIGDFLKSQEDKVEHMIKECNIIIVGVKPQGIKPILKRLSELIESRHLVISIAAGISLNEIQRTLGDKARVIRVMPNTPCLIGDGVSAYALGMNATEADRELVDRLLSQVGYAIQIEEKLMHAVIGVSGSAPAYIYMMIEAMADGGVSAGLSRQNSLKLAAKTVQGAARMVLESSKSGLTHPGVLKDKVASPSGSTMAAIETLEEHGIRYALMKAVLAACNKSKQMEEAAKQQHQQDGE